MFRRCAKTNTRPQFAQTTSDKTNKRSPRPNRMECFSGNNLRRVPLWASFVSFRKRRAVLQIPQSPILPVSLRHRKQKSLPDASIIANKDLVKCFSIFTSHCLQEEMVSASWSDTQDCACVRSCRNHACCMYGHVCRFEMTNRKWQSGSAVKWRPAQPITISSRVKAYDLTKGGRGDLS